MNLARKLLTSISCLMVAMLLTQDALANTAKDYFEDGNRLFRNDLYFAALLRYRQASEAGLETPLLDYNTGVAHYKAGQHRRARIHLEKAAQSTRLAPISHYNLGLNAWKAGSTDEALRWFRLARSQQQNERIASLARRAIARLQAADEPDPVEVRVERRQDRNERRYTKLDVRATVGFGNNDNIYRSPASDYIDFAQAAQPLVTPEVVSGAFMPVDLRLRYNLNSTLFENFYVAYRLNAQVYQDKELDNANEFVHEFSFGNSYIREKNGVRRVVYSAFKVGQHEETYFDPDNGAERNVGGVDIGDRLNFRRYGPEIRFRQSGEKLAFGAFFKGQLRNYDDVEVVPEYDHEFFSFGVSTQYKFTSTSLLRIDLEGQTRSYGDRPSFDLDGRQRLGNPAVEYDYLMASIVARQRLTRRSWFGVEYERTDRSDGYVGYNDYIRDTFKVEARWRPNAKFRLQASARYSLYDYPNAFAFNNDTLAPKTLETAMGEVEARWRVTRRLTIIGELMHREAVSNDSRIQYDQNQVMVSVEWDY